MQSIRLTKKQMIELGKLAESGRLVQPDDDPNGIETWEVQLEELTPTNSLIRVRDIERDFRIDAVGDHPFG